MIKLIVCAVRRHDFTFEQFDTYWREQHGPLVRSVTEFTRHVQRYVQCHLSSAEVPLMQGRDFDGIAELWFDSAEDMHRAFSEPRYLELIRPDELKFLDMDKCRSFVTEELEVI